MHVAVRNESKKTLLASMVGAALAAMAGQACAQAEAPGEKPAVKQEEKQEAMKVEQVIVTATRREQFLQDVPASVTAMSGKTVEKSNFRELTDIQYLAPNVAFSATNPVSNGGGYQIRGVGTQTYDSGVEQTVGLVVDGVVIGLSRDPGAAGFSDIERVEVLRGPQGTLFGKNSSAGVIQVVTKRPRIGENSGEVNLSFGERKERIARGIVNVATGATTGLRLAAYYQAQDGAIPYLVRKDGAIGDRDNKGLRAKFLWNATENLSVLVSAEHQKSFARDSHTIESLGTSALYNSQFARFDQKPGPGVYKSYQDGDWTADATIRGASVQLDYAMGDHTLTAITAYRKLESTQLSDIDAAPANIFNNSDGGVDSKEFTQELGLASPSGERLEYVAGLYYYRTVNAGWTTQVGNYYGLFGRPVVLGGGVRDQSNESRNYAAFGQGTYRLNGSLKAIAGLRYTSDKVHGVMRITPLPYPAVVQGALSPFDGRTSANNVSGKLGLQYEPNKEFMAYATYSRGYKGPAISGVSQMVVIDPETVDSYEAGTRSTLLGGRVTFNATVYSSDYKDFQAQTLDAGANPPVFTLANAGLMRTRGVELESTARLNRELDLTLGAAYSDARFKDFYGTCYTGQPLSTVQGVGCYVDAATRLQVANYAGERLPNAPKWTYLVRTSYRRAFGNGLALDATANWSWRSEAQATVADPRAAMDAYGLLNLNVGVGKQDGAWRAGIYARNLLDKQFYAPYAAGVLNPGGYYRIMSADAFRTVGVNLSMKF